MLMSPSNCWLTTTKRFNKNKTEFGHFTIGHSKFVLVHSVRGQSIKLLSYTRYCISYINWKYSDIQMRSIDDSSIDQTALWWYFRWMNNDKFIQTQCKYYALCSIVEIIRFLFMIKGMMEYQSPEIFHQVVWIDKECNECWCIGFCERDQAFHY